MDKYVHICVHMTMKLIRNRSLPQAAGHKQPSMHSVFALSLLLFSAVVNAQSLDQQVIGSSGRQYVTASARVAFTIGEPLTATLTGQDGIITQGFHQGTITVTSVREELAAAALSVHPNPAVDVLTVTTSATGAQWHLHKQQRCDVQLELR